MYQVVGNVRTRTFRVLWAMHEMGLEFEHIDAPAQSPEVQAVNPSGKVPALIVDGTTIIDSTAILTYLADKHGQLTYPAGTIERAQQDSLTHFILDEFDAALWTAARNTFVLPADKRVPEIKDTLRWEFARSIKLIEGRMSDGPNLMGDKFTIPDIILTQIGGWARVSKFDVPDGKLKDYFRRQIKRPAYISASAL
jgi:glutathione S-transferase